MDAQMGRRAALALFAVTGATALAACQTGSTDDADTTSSTSGPAKTDSDAGSFPVTVKHSLGSTTIDQAPARVVTLGWSDADVALSLGVVVVGCPKITWGGNAKGSTDPFDAELAKVGGKQPTRFDDADGAPIDDIAKLQPDLILATNSGITKAEYEKLSKIAPTVAYPGIAWGTSWQQSVDLVGKALGREKKAATVKTATTKAISDAVAKYPQIKDKTVGWVMFTPADTSKFSLYNSEDNRPRMLVEMGMKDAPMVVELSNKTDQFYSQVSAEKSRDLEADVLVFYITKPGEDATVKKDRLLGQIPAIKRGSYVASLAPQETYFLSAPSPLSIPAGLNGFVPKLAAAAKKA